MLKIYEIQVPSRTKWGGAFSKDFPVSSQVDTLLGVCANVVPQGAAAFAGTTLQAGTVSVSTNNTTVIHSAVPARAFFISNNNTLNQNLIPVENVKAGSQLRVVLEETLENPFVSGENGYTLQVILNCKMKTPC